jgi:uncharacterized membrane protein
VELQILYSWGHIISISSLAFSIFIVNRYFDKECNILIHVLNSKHIQCNKNNHTYKYCCTIAYYFPQWALC